MRGGAVDARVGQHQREDHDRPVRGERRYTELEAAVPRRKGKRRAVGSDQGAHHGVRFLAPDPATNE